ncbi:ABC transporter permease [Acidipropionibacterium jensenii]|uniref:ABC transporter permease n=2 Tax=Actinomycetes TaxID=1760 RepID=UPI002647DF9A|nr:ABC transporter permease [Acidipropionibacterium jensenii]MDN5978561.1 ABC transporter permease [Acidipropionibacterium jensenii]MDN6021739.1 ABC transporter permease [Acidipropionibacterium jensenii]MDN6426691.1 ABC transporter permease [Acidipropionibacterium jensenii]MDN6442482.1 ABC transporter permease [Acidipropionibacterium jensenii]MDN6481299.1 ABC transporter permease [Acidipropionibacterium jensenii]
MSEISVRSPGASAAGAAGVVGGSRPAGVRSAGAFLVRDLTLLRRNMASLISTFIVPGLFMVCLYAVFGHAADTIGLDYATFLFAGCLVQAALFTGAASCMAVAVDLDSGLIDRIRIYPRSTAGYLLGRMATDMVQMGLSSLAVIAVARACGMDVAASRVLTACLWGLLVALVWGGAHHRTGSGRRAPGREGRSHPDPRDAAGAVLHDLHPAASLSGALKNVVIHMPLSPVIEVTRSVLAAHGSAGSASRATWAEALCWLAGMLLVGLVLSVHALRRRRTR